MNNPFSVFYYALLPYIFNLFDVFIIDDNISSIMKWAGKLKELARHSRESGNPVGLNKIHFVSLDSRFRALLSGIIFANRLEVLQGKAEWDKTQSANSTTEPATCIG